MFRGQNNQPTPPPLTRQIYTETPHKIPIYRPSIHKVHKFVQKK